MSAPKTTLVAGGAGYIGSMLTQELLSLGHRVVVADALLFGGESLLTVLSHPAFTFSRTDITDAQVAGLFAQHDFDAVVHLASIVGDPACKAQPEVADAHDLGRIEESLRTVRAAPCSASSSPRRAATTARWKRMGWWTKRPRCAR